MRRIVQYLMVQNELNENINAREYESLNNIYYKELMSSALAQIKAVIERCKKENNTLEMNLEGIEFERFTPEINQALEELEEVEVLILISCGLQTLQGFPKLNLHAIDISHNNLSDDNSLRVLASQTNLTQIFAMQNKIQNVDTILGLKGLSNLIEIDFSDNPVTEKDNYRNEIFANFPEMSVVDRKDKDGKEVQDQQQFDDEDDEDDSEDYEAEDSDQFDEQEDYNQEDSEQKPKKGAPSGNRGKKRKN